MRVRVKAATLLGAIMLVVLPVISVLFLAASQGVSLTVFSQGWQVGADLQIAGNIAQQAGTDRQATAGNAAAVEVGLDQTLTDRATPLAATAVLLEKSSDTSDLEAYTGPIRQIFFHPLIIYPERAFDGDSLSRGYNDWFVTVGEFRKIFESLYRNNYILIDFSSVYDIADVDGKTTAKRRELLVPKGKKPLVISIDDMNYYDYMIKNGNAKKLVLDEQGYTAVLSDAADGREVQSRDDIVPMVDEFVRQHGDFSLIGAKGIIALTGYEGVMGYRTNDLKNPNYEAVKKEARDMADYLKSEGWSFASHGYGHLDANKISLSRLTKDTERWINEVETITGRTNVYIYPYGSTVPEDDPKFAYLLGKGFQVFCGVGPDGSINFGNGYMTLERKSVDGLSLHLDSRYLKDMFDSNTVIDSSRPNEY